MRKKETDTKVSVSFFSHCRDIGRSVHDIHGCLDACALGIGAHDRADLLGDAALAADDLTHILGATRSSSVSSSPFSTSVTVT